MSSLKLVLSDRGSARILALGAILLIAVGIALGLHAAGPVHAASTPDNSDNTTTPIKHVVVIYDENVSFDHYFATYPYASNTDGTTFHAAADTPTNINTELSAGLIPGNQDSAENPNSSASTSSAQYTSPNPNEYQPARLGDNSAITCDQNHSYSPEQSAEDGGAMDKFVQSTLGTCSTTGVYSSPGLNMDYYDGNTVTAMWNYAQNYAMSDNNWDDVFGPSTPGALDVTAGNTYSGSSTVNGDVDPNGDKFGSNSSSSTATMSGANIGDLLNAKNVSWGWFQGGFSSTSSSHANVIGASSEDYSSHHDPFQYYASTANWAHTAPANGAEVGFSGQANHEYDISAFNDIFSGTAINGSVPSLPAVSYLKAPEYEDGHASYSDPLDEQEWLTTQINQIEQSKYWDSTAIVITYDDSDGWYDHQAPVITNSSSSSTYSDQSICMNAASAGVPSLSGQAGRCGPSQRLPLIVISPYAKKNYVSHVLTDQSSVLKFIETNWNTGSIDSISKVPGSFDSSANNLTDMFDFTQPQTNEVLLNSTMYNVGFTSGENNISPNFGAVSSTPADATAPTPAPVITVNQNTLTIPQGSTLPTTAQLVSQLGATISAGTLSADLSSVNASTVGTYQATLTGAVGDVPADNPQTITVVVAPTLSLSHPTLYFSQGANPSASYVGSLAGASVSDGGTLNPVNLSTVNFATPGTYDLALTGTAAGITSAPQTLAIVVQGSGDPLGPPVVSVKKSTLTYAAGADPTPAQIASDSGASITPGVLSTIDVSGVDFNTPGSYTVEVGGSNDGVAATPVPVTIVVITAPAITVAQPTITAIVGNALSSDQVIGESQASMNEGTLAAADLSKVNFNAVGQYPATLTGSYAGIAAKAQTVTINVIQPTSTSSSTGSSTGTSSTSAGTSSTGTANTAAATAPAASATAITAKLTTARYPAAASVTATVTAASGTPTGFVSFYAGSQLIKTVTLSNGKATASLTGLKPGRTAVHAFYLGSTVVTSGSSSTVNLTVSKALSTVKLTASAKSAAKGHAVRFGVAVSAAKTTPAGTVELRDGKKVLKKVALVKGKATFNLTNLPVGADKLTVAYLGSSLVAASTSKAVAVTVRR